MQIFALRCHIWKLESTSQNPQSVSMQKCFLYKQDFSPSYDYMSRTFCNLPIYLLSFCTRYDMWAVLSDFFCRNILQILRDRSLLPNIAMMDQIQAPLPCMATPSHLGYQMIIPFQTLSIEFSQEGKHMPELEFFQILNSF